MIGVTMADVLAKHQIDHQHDTVLHEQCACGRRWMMGRGFLEAHQADMLAAAGFGHIWTALDDKAEQED